MAKLYVIVDRNRASLGLRFVNYLIDLIIFYVFFMVIVLLVGFATGDLQEIANKMEQINPWLDRILTILFYAVFMFFQEIIFKGRSIGKFITGTGVIKSDGSIPSTYDLFIRNISKAVPFDGISFVFGYNGWHDHWSDTRVVSLKNYRAEKQSQEEIMSIGNGL